jgi:Demerecviridae HNH endonuclease
MMPELSFEEVSRLLDYDPLTGIFKWKVRRGLKRNAGDLAGGSHTSGHIYIEVNGRARHAARLAWLLTTGHYPKAMVDHRDTNPANNRFDNLREATRIENGRNVGLTKRNTSGLKGASWYGPNGKWAGKIRVNGRLLHLGYFPTVEAAHAAYVAAAHEHFGEFARVA